jgi:rhamnulose-1-phosphate aldolase
VSDLIPEYPALSSMLENAMELSAYLWQKGWAERNAGNLSVDVTDHLNTIAPDESLPLHALEFSYPILAGRYFLVTGTGRRFRDLAKDAGENTCLLRISDGGNAYRIFWGGLSGPGFRPTSEFPAHLRVHEYLRQSNAPEFVVLHTHPTDLIALTHLPEFQDEGRINMALWGSHPEVRFCVARGMGLVPYTMPGTEALALATVEALRRGHSVAMWQKHGCVAVGTGVMEAFDLIDTLDKGARIILLCKAAGSEPQYLTKAQMDDLARAFGLKE